MGIPSYTLQASGPLDDLYSRFSLFRDDFEALTLNSSPTWYAIKDFPITKKESRTVVSHFRALSKATSPWVYSTKFKGVSTLKLRNSLKIPEQSKVLLLTASSADEMFAIKLIGVDPARTHIPPIFESQVDWIKSVCEYVSRMDHLFLIVRIHPREFANKREIIHSKNGRDLIEMLKNFSPNNIYVNLPSDGISLYDFAKLSDLLLTGNSSVGAELATLGVPLLCHDQRNLTAFPDNLAVWASSRSEYFSLIDKILRTETPEMLKVNAIRWFNFKFSYASKQTKASRAKTLLRAESLLRRPILKYNLRIPRTLIIIIYWLQMLPLKRKRGSEFNSVISKRLSGLHEVDLRLRRKPAPTYEFEAVARIERIFRRRPI